RLALTTHTPRLRRPRPRMWPPCCCPHRMPGLRLPAGRAASTASSPWFLLLDHQPHARTRPTRGTTTGDAAFATLALWTEPTRVPGTERSGGSIAAAGARGAVTSGGLGGAGGRSRAFLY